MRKALLIQNYCFCSYHYHLSWMSSFIRMNLMLIHVKCRAVHLVSQKTCHHAKLLVDVKTIVKWNAGFYSDNPFDSGSLVYADLLCPFDVTMLPGTRCPDTPSWNRAGLFV